MPYLKDFESKPHFIVLAETWLREGAFITSPGYVSTHNCRTDGKGGVSVLIRKGIRFSSFIPGVGQYIQARENIIAVSS